nr:F-box/LRR-repeat protein 15 isoform X2 [Plodia interpunctella]
MKRNTQLFDLYWEDILVSKIIPQLTIRECFNFRCVSKTCLQIINMYFSKLKSLKLMNKGFSPHTFGILKLGRCTWLTTGAMEALALHQSKLEDVDLSYCVCISESCILICIKKFRHLKTVNLEGNKQITDKSLYALAKYSKSLKLLNLGGCCDITDKGVRALALHSHKLEGLLLRGCVKVTENSIKLMRNRVHVDRKPIDPVPIPLLVL